MIDLNLFLRNKKPHRIIASRPPRPDGETLYAWDVETWGLNAPAFAFGCVVNVETGAEHTFHDASELRRFFEDNAPCRCFAHNGNRYDCFSILSKREAYEAKKLSADTRVFEYEVSGVKYVDTKHLIPLRLAQIAESVSMAKGETPQAFIKATPRVITDKDIEYCLMDCRILAAVINRLHLLFATLVGVSKNEVSLPLTTASMAYRIWCSMSWPDHWVWRDARGRERPIGRCRPGFNDLYRLAEHGGRVQVMCDPLVPESDVVSYDANSLYPSVMHDELFPDLQSVGHVGASFAALRREIDRPDRVCMADVRMSAPEGVPCFLPNTDEDGRKDWTQDTFDGYLCEPELRLALEVGWEVEEVRDIISARAMRPFQEYVRRLYDLRVAMREEGDPAHGLCKLLMNALYGRFGIKSRPTRVEGAEAISAAQERDDYLERYELNHYDGIGLEWPYLLDYGAMRKPPASQWFGFSSFILSYGRERLARGIIAAGEDVLYCDTDSIHIRASAAARLEAAIPMGDDLSEWKLETPRPIPWAQYWEAKAYCHKDAEGNRLLVKHKGVQVKDDQGNWMPHAGDLTKEQVHRTTVSLYEALRRNLEPGTEIITTKRSHRFWKPGVD